MTASNQAHVRSNRRILAASALTLILGLVLAACGGSEAASPSNTEGSDVTVVRVALTESGKIQGVESDTTTFHVGVPYHFIVENTGTRSHELMIIEPVEPGSIDMEELDEMALTVAEADDLGPGDSYEFDFTFSPASAGQNLELACYLEGHYEAGMHQSVSVEL